MITSANGRRRIRVSLVSAEDRCWQQLGRPHFLNRAAFERHGPPRVTVRDEMRLNRHLSVTPLLEAAVVFGLVWALWRLTEYLCPTAAWVMRWVFRRCRHSVGSTLRWLQHVLWRDPVRRLGVGVTAWLWLVGLILLSLVPVLVSGQFVAIWSVVPWVVLAVMWWLLLRWRRQRLYRPRPLPGRRRDFHG